MQWVGLRSSRPAVHTPSNDPQRTGELGPVDVFCRFFVPETKNTSYGSWPRPLVILFTILVHQGKAGVQVEAVGDAPKGLGAAVIPGLLPSRTMHYTAE